MDDVLPEPLGGAHRNPLEMADTLKQALSYHLTTLRNLPPEQLLAARYAKFRQMGQWRENSVE